MSKHPTDVECSSDDFSTHSTPAEKLLERKLLLKLDFHVMPILFLLFLISFVDRSNLANARIEGLEKSLHMDPKGNGYNIALFSFTIPFVLFEVPSNIVLKKVPPMIWLSGIMICWGQWLKFIPTLPKKKLSDERYCRPLYHGSGPHPKLWRTCNLPGFDGLFRVWICPWQVA